MVNKEQEEKFAAFKEDDLKNNRGRNTVFNISS